MSQMVYGDKLSQCLSAVAFTFSSDLLLFIFKFWKESLEFSFYSILFGKHTVVLSKINQCNLIRFSFKKRNKKEQDQPNWISGELTSGHIRETNGKSIQIHWTQLHRQLGIKSRQFVLCKKKLNFKAQLNKPKFCWLLSLAWFSLERWEK